MSPFPQNGCGSEFRDKDRCPIAAFSPRHGREGWKGKGPGKEKRGAQNSEGDQRKQSAHVSPITQKFLHLQDKKTGVERFSKSVVSGAIFEMLCH